VIFLNRLIRCIDRMTRRINGLSMITLILLMTLIIAGIIARIIGVAFSGVTNLSESLLVIAIYLSIAYTQQTKQHVAVEFLIGSLNEKNRKLLSAINVIIPIVICSIIVFASWDYAIDSWRLREKMDGAPFYPIYPPKIAIAVGVSFLWLQLIADFFRGVLALLMKSEESHG